MNIPSKPLAVLGLLAVVAISLFLANRSNKVKAVQTAVIPGSLEALAQDAIDRNLQSVTISTPHWNYAGVSGINEAVAAYSVVVARPVSKHSYIWNSEFQIIGTWYKFAITESLSQKPFTTCTDCPPSPTPPNNLLPLNSNELVIPKFGGVVSINGVAINSIDEVFPDYDMSQNYLLFLRIDAAKGIGLTSLGPAAVFTVSPNGALSTIAEGTNNSLATDIAQRYGNSLAALRAALKP